MVTDVLSTCYDAKCAEIVEHITQERKMNGKYRFLEKGVISVVQQYIDCKRSNVKCARWGVTTKSGNKTNLFHHLKQKCPVEYEESVTSCESARLWHFGSVFCFYAV